MKIVIIAGILCATLACACQKAGDARSKQRSAGVSAKPAPGAPKTAAVTATTTDELRLPSDHVVARWNDGELTYGQVHAASAAEFRKLKNKYLQDLHGLEQQQAQTEAVRRLVDGAAAAAGKKPEAYLEVAAGNPVVTAEEVKAFWKENLEPQGRPFTSDLDLRLRQHLSNQKKQANVSAAIEGMMTKAGLKLDVPPPAFDVVKFDLANHPMKGNPDAKVTVVEFSDFQCPYCSRAAPAALDLVKAYPDDVRVFFFHYPLGFHQQAMPAAIAAQCGNLQGKFWPIHDRIFAAPQQLTRDRFVDYAKQESLDVPAFEKCLDDPAARAFVEADMAQGEAAGVSGTPSFYIDGVPFAKGIPTVEDLKAHVQ